MESYNKLSHNLKERVLDNIFKNNTNKYHKLINEQINNLYNNLNILYNDSFCQLSHLILIQKKTQHNLILIIL